MDLAGKQVSVGTFLGAEQGSRGSGQFGPP